MAATRPPRRPAARSGAEAPAEPGPKTARASGKAADRVAEAAARIEWIAAAVSGAIVLGLVGALLREALTAADTAPDLRVTPAEPQLRDGRPHLRFVLENLGGRTASAVGVALQLRDGGAVVDTRRLTVAYVPGRSEVSGGFYLDAQRPGLTPVVVVEGYVDP